MMALPAKTTVSLPSLAKMIDHSLLHPTMTDAEIEAGLQLSRDYDVATACIKPYSIAQAKRILAGSSVKICAVIGFPHGNSATKIKVIEAQEAVAEGAHEIDMVVNVGKVLGGDWDYVSTEISAVNYVVKQAEAILKVIFENDYLGDKEIIKLCKVCTEVGVAFVKTSTGYGFVKDSASGMYSYKGATFPHLRLMREHCGKEVQIKAAGGVRTLDDLIKVKALGVTRIGATATVAMLEEAKKRGIGDEEVEVEIKWSESESGGAAAY
jgi:deoxyribose-phosphate aldolase